MRLKLGLFLLFVNCGQFLLAQSNISKDEFGILICKKWKMTEAKMGDIKIPSSEIGENIMEFESNGTFKVLEQGESYSGKWVFDSVNQELLTDDRDGKEKHKIIKLTEDELITEVTDSNGAFKMKFKRI
jgi:hypothetical protein